LGDLAAQFFPVLGLAGSFDTFLGSLLPDVTSSFSVFFTPFLLIFS